MTAITRAIAFARAARCVELHANKRGGVLSRSRAKSAIRRKRAHDATTVDDDDDADNDVPFTPVLMS